jgi:hypothetical protein
MRRLFNIVKWTLIGIVLVVMVVITVWKISELPPHGSPPTTTTTTTATTP